MSRTPQPDTSGQHAAEHGSEPVTPGGEETESRSGVTRRPRSGLASNSPPARSRDREGRAGGTGGGDAAKDRTRTPVEPGGPSDREFHLRRVVASFNPVISPAGALRLIELLGDYAVTEPEDG